MSEVELARKEIDRMQKGLDQLSRRIDSLATMAQPNAEAGSAEGVKMEDMPAERIAQLFSSLAHVERVKILKTLYGGGKYFTELMNETGLSHSPLYFHLNVLQKDRYVNQEFARGRYLITSLGSEALRVAFRLFFVSQGER